MLEIKNLHVKIADEEREILKGLSLTLPKGEVHAIMGPNGSGKSTLAYVLAGREDYEVTDGDIRWNGESLLEMEPEERAAKGVFLAFQYPMEIPGVAGLTFLRTAANAVRKARGQAELSTPEFLKFVKERAARLDIDIEMLKRPVNVGFSGGEKKRSEILQMEMLEPTLCVLDETDSGLDIDALRIVADGVNAMRAKDRSMLVITHYQRLLDYIVPGQGARHDRWAHREVRRAGAGARARDLGLRRIPGEGRVSIKATLPIGEDMQAAAKAELPAGAHARVSEALGRREMNVAVLKTKAEQALTETFAAIADKLPGGAAALKRREEAIGRFSALGLPHRRIEAWKYTDLRNLMKEALPPSVVAAPVSAKQLDEVLGPLAKLEAMRVVFVDGFYAEALSDTRSVPGLAVMALRQALAERRRMIGRLRNRGRQGRAHRGAEHRLRHRRRGHRHCGQGQAREAAADRQRQREPGAALRRYAQRRRGRCPCARDDHRGVRHAAWSRYRRAGERAHRDRSRHGRAGHAREVRAGHRPCDASRQLAGRHRRESRLSWLPVHLRRGAGPQPARAHLQGPRGEDRSLRRLPGAGPRAHRHDARRRSRGPGLHEPRAVQGRARGRGPRHLPGQGHRAAGCAEDRRQADGESADAVAQCRVRFQARARDLCRRRCLRPRLDQRRPRPRICCSIAGRAASRSRRRARC